MAQGSAFHDGTTIGDAAASASIITAPYSSTEFSYFMSLLFGSQMAKGFVVPDYASNLAVVASSPAAMTVEVAAGALFLRGRFHESNGTEIMTIATADATNPRLDRIVVEYNQTNQTIRLAVVTGTPAATPSLPALTQTATQYQISIAYVWVAATTTTIDNEDIHDERIFAPNFEERLEGISHPQLLRNSEFLASITSRTYPPASWSLVSTPSAIATTTKPSQMSRGNAVQITADAANEGISQSFSCKASTIYSIKALINVTAGDVGSIVVTDNGASPATITRNIRRTGAWVEETIYYTTPNDATTVTVQLRANANTDIVQIGQVLAVEGFSPGIFRPINPTESLTLLDEIELTANASSVTFNIPAGFKHLRIIIAARGTSAAVNELVALRFNGDTGANYDNGYTVYDGSSWSDVENYGATSLGIGQIAGNNATANVVGVIVIDIPDYLEATFLHTALATWGFHTATSAPGMRTGVGQGKWRTAAALTSVTAMTPTGNFASGSRISLFGLS